MADPLGLLLASLLAISVPTGPESKKEAAKTFEVESHLDIAYYNGKDVHDKKHKLDLYLPRGAKDFPVLFFVHGGAWRSGDKNYMGVYSSIGKFFARHGIGAVITNYRLSPAVKHPEHARDVARALAWTCKNINKYGGNKEQIFTCGHSAGGHLVALVATDESYLKAEGLTPKAIRGVIPISGVYVPPPTGLDDVFGKDPEARKKAFAITHVKDGLPAFLVLYADKDYPYCGKDTSEKFCTALRARKVPVESKEITNSSHIKIITSLVDEKEPVGPTILSFIRKHCGKDS